MARKMIEVEAKYRVKKPEYIKKIEEIITDEKYEYIDTVEEIDTYYNHPCRDFKKTDEVLRIRIRSSGSSKIYILTYKGPRKYSNEIKSRTEYEVKIHNHRIMDEILQQLGFKKIAVIRKRRRIYRGRRAEITIDVLENIGTYLEIEGPEEEIKRLYDRLEQYLVPEPRTYLEIIFGEG